VKEELTHNGDDSAKGKVSCLLSMCGKQQVNRPSSSPERKKIVSGVVVKLAQPQGSP